MSVVSPALLVGSAAAVVVGLAVLLNRRPGAIGGHTMGSSGWVESDPHSLASGAGVSDNVYALASMMQSEAGGNKLLRIACGWTARNAAASRGLSLFRLLTRAGKYDKTAKAFAPHPSNGLYGPQNVGPRYASTRQAPSAAALEDAALVLENGVDDPTGGATQFDAPGAQDSFLGKVAGYFKSAEDVAKDRTKSSELVMVPGITNTRFWRPRTT